MQGTSGRHVGVERDAQGERSGSGDDEEGADLEEIGIILPGNAMRCTEADCAATSPSCAPISLDHDGAGVGLLWTRLTEKRLVTTAGQPPGLRRQTVGLILAKSGIAPRRREHFWRSADVRHDR